MSGFGDSTNGGDLGEDERILSSEHDDAASEQGRLASVGSFCVSGLLVSVSTDFLLHLDCPHARKPFANGLLSIFNFVILSFCKQLK